MDRLQRVSTTDVGFAMIELMFIVGLIGVLLLVAIPVYVSARGTAAQRTCFQNQNTLSRAAQLYPAVHLGADLSDLEGVVDDDHPLRVENIIGATPRCPSGDEPVDPDNPTVAEGAYSFDASGSIVPCTQGELSAHGSFED